MLKAFRKNRLFLGLLVLFICAVGVLYAIRTETLATTDRPRCESTAECLPKPITDCPELDTEKLCPKQ